MARRSLLAVLVGLFTLALAPAASAVPDGEPFAPFAHNSSRDGTPNEVRSGFYGGDDGNNADGDPLADRVPNSYETFEFQAEPGHGSFNVHIEWADPRVDLDLYVYRLRPDGGIVSTAVASSAQGNTNSEDATYIPPVGQVEADRYLIVVDNWCSRNDEGGACYSGAEVPDEDNFKGFVTYGPGLPTNPLPGVSLAGPSSGAPGQLLTFTASASDDESVANYSFDLDGDGFFETNRLQDNTVSNRFDEGFYNVGVRVTDNEGGKSYANLPVTISTPVIAPAPNVIVVMRPQRPLDYFKLPRGPSFGGVKKQNLVVRYRLRERSRVVVSLYRGSKRVRRLATGTKPGNRTYRMVVKSAGLRRGLYSARISVRGASSNKRETARLYAKRL